MKYVALLRGINVGGKNMVSMERLCGVFSSVGFEGVKSYINSGNIVFHSRKQADDKLSTRIHDAVKNQLEIDVSIVVRTIDEIEDVIGNNPLDGEFEDYKKMQVLFLNEELPKEKERLLLENSSEGEQFAVRGREIFCHLKSGFADSLLAKGFIEKKLKVVATARNWRTVKKIAEM
jgi:uncharacterized protein (DUF1697 family)